MIVSDTATFRLETEKSLKLTTGRIITPSGVSNSIQSEVGRLYGLREDTTPEKASTATLLSAGKFFFTNLTKTQKTNKNNAKK